MKQNTGFCFIFWIGGDWMYDKSGQRKYLNLEERAAFFREVMAEPDLSKRAFCMILFYSGCRMSEALNLTWERVDYSEQSIIFETLKQHEEGVFRSILVPVSLIDSIKNMKRVDEHLWDYSRSKGWRIINDKMLNAGISGSKATSRGLRHSFAVSYIQKGVPITTVQKWLGHKRLETTAIYLNTVGEEERELASKIW